LEGAKKMKLGKRVKRFLGKPKRYATEVKVKSFAVGYTTVLKEYDRIALASAQAAKELQLGVVSSASRRFFAGRILRRFFKKNEQGQDLLFKQHVMELVDKWNSGQWLQEDGVWLRNTFLPYLEECKQRDLAKLQRMFKFEKGVPFVGKNSDQDSDG